ncbi:hypothetical protein D3C72_2093100 [compost metagenome]
MNELTANAVSLAYMGRMPMTEAATSMSRIAIHWRPMAPRTRFLASRLKITTRTSTNRYFSMALCTGRPKAVSGGTDTLPDDE